jgi:hypothetical protein
LFQKKTSTIKRVSLHKLTQSATRASGYLPSLRDTNALLRVSLFKN